jgi:hypothetical protein
MFYNKTLWTRSRCSSSRCPHGSSQGGDRPFLCVAPDCVCRKCHDVAVLRGLKKFSFWSAMTQIEFKGRQSKIPKDFLSLYISEGWTVPRSNLAPVYLLKNILIWAAAAAATKSIAAATDDVLRKVVRPTHSEKKKKEKQRDLTQRDGSIVRFTLTKTVEKNIRKTDAMILKSQSQTKSDWWCDCGWPEQLTTRNRNK